MQVTLRWSSSPERSSLAPPATIVPEATLRRTAFVAVQVSEWEGRCAKGVSRPKRDLLLFWRKDVHSAKITNFAYA